MKFTMVMQQQSLSRKFNTLKRGKMLADAAIKIMLSEGCKKNFTIGSLAARLGTNETTLKYAFKANQHMTIYCWFQQYRMDIAISMMKKGYSISYIASAIGYTHIAHFSYAFKRIYGVAPSVYAKVL